MKITITLICLIAFTLTAFCSDSFPDTSFADFLFHEKEFELAVTEYYRYIFVIPDSTELSRQYYLQIIKCYFLSEQYEKCTRLANDIIPTAISNNYSDELNRYSGLSYLQMGYPRVGLINFENISDRKAQLYKCISHLYLSQTDKASQALKLAPVYEDSLLNTARIRLLSAVEECNNIRYKKPLLAGAMSAVLPGSGYLYTGYYQTAFSSLILNALLLGTANELLNENFKFTGGTMALISFGWYIGNIYGSYNAAIKTNERRRRAILDKYKSELEFLFR